MIYVDVAKYFEISSTGVKLCSETTQIETESEIVDATGTFCSIWIGMIISHTSRQAAEHFALRTPHPIHTDATLGCFLHVFSELEQVHVEAHKRPEWKKTTSFVVCTLSLYWARRLGTLKQLLLAHPRIRELIAAFCPRHGCFEMPPSHLVPLGARRQGVLNSQAEVGTLAAAKRTGFPVLLVDRVWSWDERAACQALQNEKEFSANCWHIHRMFHRARRCGGTEAPCESWFSQLKYVYDARHGPEIGSLAEKLSLRVAGLRGNGGDDQIVRAIAAYFSKAKPRKSPVLARFAEEAAREWQKRPMLLEDTDVLTEARGHKLRTIISNKRKHTEKAELGDASKKLLSSRSKGLWQLPLMAANRKQWETDRKHDTTQGQRAQGLMIRRAAAKPQQVRKGASVKNCFCERFLNMLTAGCLDTALSLHSYKNECFGG